MTIMSSDVITKNPVHFGGNKKRSKKKIKALRDRKKRK